MYFIILFQTQCDVLYQTYATTVYGLLGGDTWSERHLKILRWTSCLHFRADDGDSNMDSHCCENLRPAQPCHIYFIFIHCH